MYCIFWTAHLKTPPSTVTPTLLNLTPVVVLKSSDISCYKCCRAESFWSVPALALGSVFKKTFPRNFHSIWQIILNNDFNSTRGSMRFQAWQKRFMISSVILNYICLWVLCRDNDVIMESPLFIPDNIWQDAGIQAPYTAMILYQNISCNNKSRWTIGCYKNSGLPGKLQFSEACIRTRAQVKYLPG